MRSCFSLSYELRLETFKRSLCFDWKNNYGMVCIIESFLPYKNYQLVINFIPIALTFFFGIWLRKIIKSTSLVDERNETMLYKKRTVYRCTSRPNTLWCRQSKVCVELSIGKMNLYCLSQSRVFDESSKN